VPRTDLARPRTIEALPRSFSAPRTGQGRRRRQYPFCPIGCNLILQSKQPPFLILKQLPETPTYITCLVLAKRSPPKLCQPTFGCLRAFPRTQLDNGFCPHLGASTNARHSLGRQCIPSLPSSQHPSPTSQYDCPVFRCKTSPSFLTTFHSRYSLPELVHRATHGAKESEARYAIRTTVSKPNDALVGVEGLFTSR
jgi:hypothetical protein